MSQLSENNPPREKLFSRTRRVVARKKIFLRGGSYFPGTFKSPNFSQPKCLNILAFPVCPNCGTDLGHLGQAQ